MGCNYQLQPITYQTHAYRPANHRKNSSERKFQSEAHAMPAHATGGDNVRNSIPCQLLFQEKINLREKMLLKFKVYNYITDTVIN